jgi:hypothetical protein
MASGDLRGSDYDRPGSIEDAADEPAAMIMMMPRAGRCSRNWRGDQYGG